MPKAGKLHGHHLMRVLPLLLWIMMYCFRNIKRGIVVKSRFFIPPLYIPLGKNGSEYFCAVFLTTELDGSWCKNVAEKFNLTNRQTDGIAMPIAERSYVIRYVKLLAMHGRRNRGSRVSGCFPNFWGAGAVLPRNLHFYVNLSFVVFRLFNHTSHCCTLCSRKHVTTFLMIS